MESFEKFLNEHFAILQMFYFLMIALGVGLLIISLNLESRRIIKLLKEISKKLDDLKSSK